MSRSAASVAAVNDHVLEMLAVAASEVGWAAIRRPNEVTNVQQGAIVGSDFPAVDVRVQCATHEGRASLTRFCRQVVELLEELIGESNGDLPFHGMQLYPERDSESRPAPLGCLL